jgi:predicted permease
MPLTALLLARALGLDPLASTIVVMFAAVPTSPAASVLASRMGGDGPLAAFLITVSTLASAATLPLWLALVRGSG